MCPPQDLSNTTPKELPPLALKKQVRFGEAQERFLAPLPLELLREDLYYSPEELYDQKHADIDAKRYADCGADSMADLEIGLCFRGLEHSLKKGERRRRISNHIQKVLEVHQEQKELKYRDDYELFIVARTNSKNDRKTALKLAAQDAEDAAILHACSETSEAASTGPKRKRRSLKRWVKKQFSCTPKEQHGRESLRLTALCV